jgi:hypothetical protein
MKYTIILFLFLFIFSCTESGRLKNINLESDSLKIFMTYGMPESQEVENYIAKNYGFKLVQVAGCVITKEFADSIDLINTKQNLYLQNQYGKNWENNYKLQVEELKNKLLASYDILHSYKPYLIKKKELEKDNYFLSDELSSFDSIKNTIIVDTYKFLDARSNPKFIKLKTYEIDFNRKIILKEY